MAYKPEIDPKIDGMLRTANIMLCPILLVNLDTNDFDIIVACACVTIADVSEVFAVDSEVIADGEIDGGLDKSWSLTLGMIFSLHLRFVTLLTKDFNFDTADTSHLLVEPIFTDVAID